MQLIDNTDAPNDSLLVPNVISTGTPTNATSYEIAPEDQHYADAILAMDPLTDVPTPHEFPADLKHSPLKLTALSPDMQRDVRQRLASVPPEQRAAKEAEFTAEAIQAMRGSLRAAVGVGSTALPYHREMAGIAGEVRFIHQRLNSVQASLDATTGFASKFNPATGESEPVKVYQLTGARRAAAEQEIRTLLYQRSLLINEDGSFGIESKDRMQRALHESVQMKRQLAEQVADQAEVKRRTAAQLREERIAQQVEVGVRMRRHSS
jgi:hypothetical protein